MSVEDFPIKKASLSIEINEFNSAWYDPDYFIIISGNDVNSIIYELNIFDLLNINKRIADSLMYFNESEEVLFKIYGDWRFN